MGPYLALPVLKSYLQEVEQYKVDIVDLNVEFYDDLLSFRHVEECCKRYRESKDSFSSNVQLTIELIQKSALNVDEAKDIFRSKRYFNLKERQYAENIFRNALYIINHVSYGVKYTFNSIDLPYDYYSTPEIMKSLADTLHNPFISFYETAFLKRIQREKIEFIGISVSGCFQLISAVTLAKLIKEECPSVKHVSLGGNYITRLADDCMKEWHPFFEYIDSIMMYDGEEPLARLLEALDSGDDNLDCVPNLCHAKGGKIYKNHRIEQTFINDTVPDFDGFALSKYFMPELILPVYSSRQCFNHCAFCTIPGATGGCYRKMPISRVFEIMCRLNEKYGTRVFSFVDETFEGKRMEQLADEINASGKTFFWHGETRFSPTLSTDVFNKIYQSGCRQIQFGLESYNQRVLEALRWFLWERFRHRPSSAGENNDLELKRPREGPFPRHPPMIAKPNSDNRRGVTHEESTTSRPRSGPHGRPGRAHRGRAHRRERPALQARAAPLPRMRQGLRLLRHGEPRGPQAVEGDGPGALGLLPGVRALQGALPGARRAHRGRPLGAARGALHARLRGLGGVAGGPLHRLGGLRARPRRVAQRGRRVQARLRRAGGRARRLEVRRC